MEEEIKIEEKKEIEEALKKLAEEEASRAPKVPETKGPEVSTMVRWVMKLGIKEERQAEYILLGIAALAFLISIFLLFSNILPKEQPAVPMFRQDIDPAVRETLPPGVLETIPSRNE